jgi:hypothetical protein
MQHERLERMPGACRAEVLGCRRCSCRLQANCRKLLPSILEKSAFTIRCLASSA